MQMWGRGRKKHKTKKRTTKKSPEDSSDANRNKRYGSFFSLPLSLCPKRSPFLFYRVSCSFFSGLLFNVCTEGQKKAFFVSLLFFPQTHVLHLFISFVTWRQ
mmetsp:Transcript_11773/g.31698  ORF Transcript_11773/g.31698 Transcript_11773/m.31698 type:complete len:102 (-) Transcript_11773:2670-2975(-)